MQNIPQITDAELEVMKIIWDRHPVSTNEIVAALEGKTNWNNRTIHTLISRLEKKGAISHTKDGRIFIYSPSVNREEYLSCASRSFINRFYNGAVSKMIMNFVENDMLTDDDIQELRDILQKRE